MKVRLDRPRTQVQVSRRAMADYMLRARAEEHAQAEWDRCNLTRQQELQNYATSLDATMLWALHVHPRLKMGKKQLRDFWELLIRTRVEFRTFYRGDADTYELRNTGENAEDIALISALRDIGVDLEAWEAEEVEINQRTGECEFIGKKE